MSDAPKERFNVTADDLRRYDWQARIAASNHPDCHEFYTELMAAVNRGVRLAARRNHVATKHLKQSVIAPVWHGPTPSLGQGMVGGHPMRR